MHLGLILGVIMRYFDKVWCSHIAISTVGFIIKDKLMEVGNDNIGYDKAIM